VLLAEGRLFAAAFGQIILGELRAFLARDFIVGDRSGDPI
jgi:hypothetical protein